MYIEVSDASIMTERKEPIDIMEIGCAFAHAETITRRDREFISHDELWEINDLLSKATDVFVAIHELSLVANELNNNYHKKDNISDYHKHCNCAACVNRNERNKSDTNDNH